MKLEWIMQRILDILQKHDRSFPNINNQWLKSFKASVTSTTITSTNFMTNKGPGAFKVLWANLNFFQHRTLHTSKF